MRQEFICSMNKMQQTHRGDRQLGEERGVSKGMRCGCGAGHRKEDLGYQVHLLYHFAQQQSYFTWCAQIKTICGGHLRPWWVTMHMQYFRGYLSTSVWPLAMPTLTSCSRQQISTERSGIFHTVCLWIGRECLFILTECSQAKCI